MKKIYVKIYGIHCNHCIDIISKELLKNKKIKKVDFKNDIAIINYNEKIYNHEIIEPIVKLGYITKNEYISNNIKDVDSSIKIIEFIIILVVILLVWFLINKIFGYNIFNIIPNIDSSITYGMLFVTGLLTSIHCISMCGAINLVAVIDNEKKNYRKPILYNLGRVISYTVIGGIAGLIGSVISFNNTIRGIIILLTSILMFLMALSMLGIIKYRFNLFSKIRIKNKSKNSFIIGLLNGLMPCGPLQAMQVYALSTGSIFKGALSMFLFSLGTVPLMLGVGLLYNYIRGKGKFLINKIASILILVLSIVMLNRGLLNLGIDITKNFNDYEDFTPSVLVSDYQVVEFDLEYTTYKDIIVQKGIPVKMIINVDEKYLTSCNNAIDMKEFGIQKELTVGENIIEFTPDKEGIYTYTCWMNMIKNNIRVVDDIEFFKEK